MLKLTITEIKNMTNPNTQLQFIIAIKKKLEDTKEVIRRSKSKDGQCNGQKKKANNDLQHTTQKTKDRATGIPLQPPVNPGVQEWLVVPVPLLTSVYRK